MRKIKILFLLVFFVIAAFIYISIKTTSTYPYQVDMDYEYSFHDSNAYITNLNINDGWVFLPKQAAPPKTAFLKVDVQSTFLGKYIQPKIEMTDGKSTFIQSVEHGARGIRYLNVSSFISNKEAKFRLRGIHLSIDNQTAQLITFKNQDIQNLRILVIAPHPDDAELAAYGLYSSHKNSYILTITAGESGFNKYDEVYNDKRKQYLKKGELRTWNSITVPMLGGIPPEQALNLGFFDSTLKSMFSDKSKSACGLYTGISDINYFRKQNVSSLSSGLSGKSDWNSLVENIQYILKVIKPDIIVTPYPALDKHSDHKLSSVALFEAIKKSGIKSGYLYLYTNHFVLYELYPYGKTGEVLSIPPAFGNTFYFDEIYSRPLSADKQKDKIFAMEAMHDLRPDTEWRFTSGAIRQAARNIRRDVGLKKNKSYYRRYVRANELFFVVNISNIYDRNILNKITGKL